MLPTELLDIILVDIWLQAALFEPTQRWQLFATLSLVNHQFRAVALWVVTRHVRVLGNCSMDLAAYASIGRQHVTVALGPSSKAFSPYAYNEDLGMLYRSSTVELDITFATFALPQDRDKWLKDDIQPRRPDDEHKIFFDVTAFPDERGFVYPLSEPARVEGYKDWLSRRRRDRLSGWFADLLDAIPDCRTCIVSTAHGVGSFNTPCYAMILESLWWWRSLATIGFRAAPGPGKECGLDFFMELMRGAAPCFPLLPSVTSVSISWTPRCLCWESSKMNLNAHKLECKTRRRLLPFVNLHHLRIEATIERPEAVFPCAITSVLCQGESPDVGSEARRRGAHYGRQSMQ